MVGLFFMQFYTIPAFAANTHYTVNDLYLSFELPRSFTVVDAEKNIKGDKGEEIPYFEAVSKENKCTFQVFMEKEEAGKQVFNYKYLPPKKIASLVSGVKGGKNVTDASFIELQNNIFITSYQKQADADIHVASAQTIVNGQDIRLVFTVQGQEISIENKGVFQHIVNSVEFTQLLSKPLHINVSEILVLTVCVMVAVLVLLMIILAVYYNKNGDPSRTFFDMTPSSRGKDVASKYYDELRNDGFWNETMQIDKLGKNGEVISKKAKNKKDDGSIDFVTYHKGIKTVVATLDNWKQMSLSSEEWEEKNQEELNRQKEKEEDFFFPFDDGEGPLYKAPEKEIKGSSVRRSESGVEISRSNNDDFDEFEILGAVEESTEPVQENEPPVNAAKEYARVFLGKFHRPEDKKKGAKQSIDTGTAKEEEGYTPVAQSGLTEDTEVLETQNEREEDRFVWEETFETQRLPKRRVSGILKNDEIVHEFETDDYWDKYR